MRKENLLFGLALGLASLSSYATDWYVIGEFC